MPSCFSEYFGRLEWEPDSELTFPTGLPGFESDRRFVAVGKSEFQPFLFVQSVDSQGVCFLTVPVRVVDHDYELAIQADDLCLLGLPDDRQPELGTEVLCLAVVSAREGETPSANLLAPLIVNLKNRLAVQAIRTDSRYSLREPIGACEVEACLS